MVVHADEAGNYGVAGEIEHFRAVRNFCRGGVAERSNFPVLDDQRLIRARSGAGAVHHTHMRQREDMRVFFHKSGHCG
ncbi:MAG: hypothetical protein WBE13_01300 [Candidatus Acidiferrum sp.]